MKYLLKVFQFHPLNERSVAALAAILDEGVEIQRLRLIGQGKLKLGSSNNNIGF